MKEDYLWNKTGGDPEIERLENALKTFRYQETAPPALAPKNVLIEEKKSRGFFRLSFAFAALAVIAIICFGVWLRVSDNKTEVAKDAPKISALPIADAAPSKKSLESFNETIQMPKKSVEKKNTRIKKIVPHIIRQRKLTTRNVEIKKPDDSIVAQNIEIKKPPIKLTKEEKYAYGQLMLALSITGSKLKLVTDKIENGEEGKVVKKDKR